MSYSCLEELQLDLDLHVLDKTNILSKAGCKYYGGWFIVTNDGNCHLFDKDGNLDDVKKIKQLTEKHIRRDITKIIIPDSVTSIGSYVFDDCRGLTSVTISNSVTSIGAWAFVGCSGLTSVTIPDSVTSIGSFAFYGCSGLTSVTIPESVTSIGVLAFYNCYGLTNLMIPLSVTSIGYSAFSYCDAMTNLTFKDKTLKQVKKMNNYPWGITNKSIIRVE